MFDGNVQLEVDGWQEVSVLSLREASILANPDEFNGSKCNCKKECTTDACLCRKRRAPCTSRCHQGKVCSNQYII